MLSARVNVASTSALRVAPSARVAPSRGALVVVAASKKKDVRLQVTLECTEQKESGVMGMSRYITQKVRARDAIGVARVRDGRGGGRGGGGAGGGGNRARGPRGSSAGTDDDARDDRAQNRRNTSQRIELMKYNPFLKRHTLHRELKK